MNELERFEHLLKLLTERARPGRLADGLRVNGLSDALGVLVSLGEASDLISRRQGTGLRLIAPLVQHSLARRVLLARRADLLVQLSSFWESNGSPAPSVARAVAAAEAASAWPTATIDLSSQDWTELRFSPAYGRFVAALADIEKGDPQGPLGRAVWSSRYRGNALRSMSKPFLSGERQLPAGFPVVLGRPADSQACLTGAAWVESTNRWPGWLHAPAAEVPETLAAQHGRAVGLRTRWDDLIARVNQALQVAGYEPASPPSALPEWLVLHVAAWGVEDVESAGLALAMNSLGAAGWPLPAGVGFTGAWGEDGTLRPVSRLAEKLRAAREGGVFALFACVPPGEVRQAPLEPGVSLVLLTQGLSASEVARQVNTACVKLGLTEDRWAFASGQQSGRLRSAQAGRVASRMLPAGTAPDALPVGFFGREGLLKDLSFWKNNAPQDTRSVALIEGGMRAGKTTLLSWWLRDDAIWPAFPAWFSCLRNHRHASRLHHVRAGFESQLLARFRLLPHCRGGEADPASPAEGWSEEVRLACEATAAPIDLVIDGIDETPVEEQERILYLVASLPGQGVSVLCGQVGTVGFEREQGVSRFHVPADGEAARRLVQAFGERLATGVGEVRRFGRRLAEDASWCRRLAAQAGNNLWVLTEFLSAVMQGTASVPSGPDDLPLRPAVEEYVRLVVDQLLERHPAPERTAMRSFLGVLALLDVDARAWAPSDLATFTPAVGPEKIEEVADGALRRMLVFDGGGVHFRDDTFRQIIAANALDRDRDMGRSLSAAFVQLLEAGGNASSRFQVEFATAHAAQFVLEYAGTESSLAARLIASPWAALRFRQVTVEHDGLSPFLGELEAVVERAGTGPLQSAFRELLATLSQYRQAIESGAAPAEVWWPSLAAVSDGRVASGQEAVPHYPSGGAVLLTPPGGYHHLSVQSLSLSGAGCHASVGERERLVLGSPDGRLYLFDRRDEGFAPERVIGCGGGEVSTLEHLCEWLVLAKLQQGTEILKSLDPRVLDRAATIGPVGKNAAYLVDVESHRSPIQLDFPVEFDTVVVLEADTNGALVVITTETEERKRLEDAAPTMKDAEQESGERSSASGSTELMQIYRLTYSFRDGRLSGDVLTVPHGNALCLPAHAWRLCAFAPNTWAACLGPDRLAVYRACEGEIVLVSGPALDAACAGFHINGVCRLPGERFAAVLSPNNGPQAREGVHLLLVGADGLPSPLIRLDSGIIPDQHFNQPRNTASEMYDDKPLGWHTHHGLVLGDSGDRYQVIEPEAEAIPHSLPGEVTRVVCVPSESGLQRCGSIQLSGGRVVLVYGTFAVLLGAGATVAIPIRGLPTPGTFRLLGATSGGMLAVCDEGWFDHQRSRSGHRYLVPPQAATTGTPAEDGFLNVGPTGVCVSHAELELRTADGSSTPTELWDAGELREVLEGGEPSAVADALCIDDANWGVALYVHQPKSRQPESSSDHSGDSPGSRSDLVLVGCHANQIAHMRIRNVSSYLDCRIEALAGGLMAFRFGDGQFEDNWQRHSLHLYDLIADDLACPHHDRQIGPHDEDYALPLIRLSTEWALLLRSVGAFNRLYPPGTFGSDYSHQVYQYRIGSLQHPALIDLWVTPRISLLDHSPGRADLREWRLDNGRTLVRLIRLGVDAAFGVSILQEQLLATDLGRHVADVADLDRTLVAVAYEAAPYRVEVLRLAETPAPASPFATPGAFLMGEAPASLLAVGFLPEPPRQVVLVRGPGRTHLAVATDSGVTWFDLAQVPGTHR